MSHNSRQDGMRWLVTQIVNESLRTGDLSLMREFVNDPALYEVERLELLSAVFWHALGSQKWSIAKKALREGYPIQPEEISDYGPLHECTSRFGNRPEVVQWLIDEGAEIDRRGPSNITPLIDASQKGYVDIVRVLLRCGADVNASSVIDEDLTPLMGAARAGHDTIVLLLMNYGADASRRDRLGRDAVDYAKSSGHEEIIQIVEEQQHPGGSRPLEN